MSKKSKVIKEYRYSFTLYITQNTKGVVCQRFFEAKSGLKDDINEAIDLAMDLIYSDILFQGKDSKPCIKPNEAILTLSVCDGNTEVAWVEQSLSNVRHRVTKINIKPIVQDIITLFRK